MRPSSASSLDVQRTSTASFVRMSWLETRWIYLYVTLVGGVMAALVTALSGDGVDWALTALITVALLVGPSSDGSSRHAA